MSDSTGLSGITLGQLHPEDHTFPEHRPMFPLVMRPTGDPDFERLRASLGAGRAAFMAHLHRVGAVLLRGFDITTIEHFEAIFAALGVELSPRYPLGAATRQRVSGRAWTTTELLDDLPLTPHSEMAYRRVRPRILALFCQVPSPRYGETPIFDARAALADLDPATRAFLTAGELSWCQFYTRRRGLFSTSYEKSWPETFGTEDRAAVEQACAALDARCRWGRRGRLGVISDTPSILRHPATGEESLGFQTPHLRTFLANVKLLQPRHGWLKNVTLRALIRAKAALGTYPFETRTADGALVPAAIFEAVYAALWRHSTVFRWQAGDVLILDNLLAHHGRLNVTRPRTVYVGLGDLQPI